MGCGPSKNKRDVVDESDDLVVLLLPDGSSCSVSQAEADDARARLEQMMARLEAAESAIEAMEVAAETVDVGVDDPTEEEAKGGSLKVGKMFLSAGEARLALLCHCPPGPWSEENKAADKCNASEWMKGVLGKIPDGKGVFLEGDAYSAKGEIVADKTAGRFPLKDRDECQSSSVGWLKEKGLFEVKEDEDDWVPDEDCDIEW